MKIWMIVMQILGGLPLLAYPFVLLANVMSLAAHKTPGETKSQLAASLFLWSSTAYPVVFVACAIFAWVTLGKGHGKKALILSAAPLACLLLVAVFFWNWMRQGS